MKLIVQGTAYVNQLVLALVHGNARFNCSIVCGHYRHMFWPKQSRQLLFRQLTWLRYRAVYRLRSSCLNSTRASNLLEVIKKLMYVNAARNYIRKPKRKLEYISEWNSSTILVICYTSRTASSVTSPII